MPKVLLSHPIVNENVRNACLALAEAGLLKEICTTVSWNPDHWINRILPRKVRTELSRRAFPASVRSFIRNYPLRESGRILLGRLGCQELVRKNGRFSPIAVHEILDRQVARRIPALQDIGAVYAYDHGARDSFLSARKRGIRCIYELPIGYWRALKDCLEKEISLHPEWARIDPFKDDDLHIYLRKDEELRLADTIIVPTEFVKQTLKLAPGLNAKIFVVPYGGPVVPAAQVIYNTRSDKLRVLFVGSLGLRKGLPYLLKAVAMLKDHVDVTLIGRPDGECRPLADALKRYRWIPDLPHSQILAEMGKHDVFVFPSLFEGFGLVILEAMSQGLPVITTPHTAGPDVIDDGVDGFIVPVRSSEAVASKLEMLACNPRLLREMGEAAKRKAAKHSWQEYRRKLAEAVSQVLKR